jgi:uridylate kinase
MSSYQRVLLKLSGEALLCSDAQSSIHIPSYQKIARLIAPLAKRTQLGIVIGGGNLFRGQQGTDLGLSKTRSDQIGMLGTIINALLLQQALLQENSPTHVMSAVSSEFCETFKNEKANNYLENGNTLIFAGGTGHPYFTTDSAAALRACEIQADILIKATKVDGVYDKDPVKHSNAKRFEKLSFNEAIDLNLRVLDQTAFALCRDNSIPIRVLDLFQEDLAYAIMDTSYGTLIY